MATIGRFVDARAPETRRHSASSAIRPAPSVGPGISEADLARVLEPFYRLEASRSRDTGGAGLNLAIAQAIAQAHGGELMLSNRSQCRRTERGSAIVARRPPAEAGLCMLRIVEPAVVAD